MWAMNSPEGKGKEAAPYGLVPGGRGEEDLPPGPLPEGSGKEVWWTHLTGHKIGFA